MGWQEELERFTSIADEIFDGDKESSQKEAFIEHSMSRKGFKRVTGWADPEPDGNSGGGLSFLPKASGGRNSEYGGR